MMRPSSPRDTIRERERVLPSWEHGKELSLSRGGMTRRRNEAHTVPGQLLQVARLEERCGLLRTKMLNTLRPSSSTLRSVWEGKISQQVC